MPEEDQEGQEDQQSPPTLSDLSDFEFTQRIESFVFSRTGEQVDDATPIDTILGDKQRVSGAEGYAAELLAERKRRDEVVAEARRQVEEERLKTDREAAKAALKKKLAEERAEEERVAAEKRREQDLLDEIAQEEAAKGNGQSTPSPDGQLTTIEQSLEVIHATTKLDDGRTVKLHSEEELNEAAKRGIEVARTLESRSATFNPNRDDLAARAKARLDKMKEAK